MSVLLHGRPGDGGWGDPQTFVRACATCGWWTIWQQTRGILLDPDTLSQPFNLDGAAAELKALDEVGISAGLRDVRSWLLARYERRFELHPRMMELTVASVFRDYYGYEAAATAYSADGGIDVILRHSNGTTTGVQVKRTRAPIEVEQIRALAGALVLGGHTRGVFVTTSRFRSGAVSASSRFGELALPIELIDAGRFLAAIEITQRPAYDSYEEWEDSVGSVELTMIYENETGRG
jgi:restriction system protein